MSNAFSIRMSKLAVSLMTAFLLSAPFNVSSFVHATSTYDTAVLADNPVGYWPLSSAVTADQSGNGLNGTFTGSPTDTTMPNGDAAPVFNGTNQYFTIPDNDYLEVTRTGILTVEAWMRPDTLQFTNYEGSGYVHWMGKGTSGQHSWVARMYNQTNTENRPNRISGYSFNLSGGLGAGSYFQDTVTAGQWIHYTLVINTVNTNSTYTTGYTKVFKNGVLRDQDKLSDYSIVPGNGTAPMRIATRDLASYFQGAIGKVAVYDYELTPTQLAAHYSSMTN
ncbi:LamG-like jellyroll fold domain-containing protein [Paenibacillus sp. LjRoot56]|uniref:LamG-like jellyroll fold domain-containing protein n=1 Tax=Paenibacillus sp. LjRoot56 TaxID=3342333 RepID=UPI003ED03426